MKRKTFALLALVLAALLALCSCAVYRKTVAPGDTAGSITESASWTEPSDLVCTFSIECSTALADPSALDAALLDVLPPDGVILAEREVAFGEGESVADVLRRLCDENGIALETSLAPLYGSVYVEGIGNLYEFDCGDGSGWMYRVNGVYPNYSAGSYILSPGDRVEWKYTCSFGEDIGGGQNEHS